MNRLGLDMGTKNFVLASRRDNKEIFKREVNGFIIINNEPILRNMLLGQGVPFIERGKDIIALGARAEEIAYAFPDVKLQRPMASGVVNKREKMATQIMAILVKSLIGKLNDDTIIYYCVPGASLGIESNIDYHTEIMHLLFNSISKEVKIDAYPINEARALLIGSTNDKTGIGISCGAGMINVSYCMLGMPIYEFSIIGAGDWITQHSSEVTGESNIEYLNRRKEALVLTAEPPTDYIDRAIWVNTSILIKKVTRSIIDGFNYNEKQARAGKPMPIIIAGGTSAPDGFIELFKSVFNNESMPFDIGEMIKAPLPLFAVARGCLLAAELHS